jgi:hypothetical protein
MNPPPEATPPRPVQRTALFIITGDPRRSPRPSEAVRIAAGVAAWKTVEVTVYLGEAAVLVLDDFVDDLVDAENLREGLPLLAAARHRILAQQDSPFLPQLKTPAVPYEPTDAGALATRAAQSDVVLCF